MTDAGLRILNGSDLADRADVVVVSGHDRFDFAELKGAVQAALRGADMLCTVVNTCTPLAPLLFRNARTAWASRTSSSACDGATTSVQSSRTRVPTNPDPPSTTTRFATSPSLTAREQ